MIAKHRPARTSFFALRELLEIRLRFQRVRCSVLTPLERAAVGGAQGRGGDMEYAGKKGGEKMRK